MLQRFKMLPCLRDGDLELPQTGAIIRHLGRKLNLYGSGLEEQAMIDMLHEAYVDQREKLGKTIYTTGDFVRLRTIFESQIFRSLKMYLIIDLLQDKEKAEYVASLSDAFQPFQVCTFTVPP